MKLPQFPNFPTLPDGSSSELLKAFRDAQPLDAAAIGQTIERALASAGIDTQSSPMKAMQDTIQRALAGTPAGAAWAAPAAADDVIDVPVRELREVGEPVSPPAEPAPPPSAPQPGEFVTRSFSNAAGRRNYKLYVPKLHGPQRGSAQAGPLPLLVMLHGCTQSPDDFAAGTRMNQLAEQHGFLVVYPEQAPKANGSKCWNWFKAQDQLRDRGEPSLIAGIVREVAASHAVDAQRIFVAGLSAGAAMAVILGETYPELFAAVGVHSGLPYRVAHDVPSAFAAMKGSAGTGPLQGAAARPAPGLRQAVPTIVFHGDQDSTVDRRNGVAVLAQAQAAHAQQAPLRVSEQRGRVPGGRAYQRTVYSDAGGRPLLEDWLLHGAGHAWSGGSASGSYTDGAGPDASADMLRFFLAQRGETQV
ncbi:MAG TPA: PHB depolymerase family esterase [Ideonella sp.]|nr:PHB depolymerase family esterase [Ideonella sp.]